MGGRTLRPGREPGESRNVGAPPGAAIRPGGSACLAYWPGQTGGSV